MLLDVILLVGGFVLKIFDLLVLRAATAVFILGVPALRSPIPRVRLVHLIQVSVLLRFAGCLMLVQVALAVTTGFAWHLPATELLILRLCLANLMQSL